jgi:phosphoribosyl-ATP pyrophosphohydrolase
VSEPLDYEACKMSELFCQAVFEAGVARKKFPQPNYVISKFAEEAGEVVKAAIHCAEGRETSDNVRKEIVQAMAMLLRLYVEGDEVHRLPPIMRSEAMK